MLPVANFTAERLKEKSKPQPVVHRAPSAIEDGSSGGETGNTGRRHSTRSLNPHYLGEYDETPEIETIAATTAMELRDPKYCAMRLKLVLKLWPRVQEALNSPWSNIRSICYGLICSMLKVDIRSCTKWMPQAS